MQDFESSGKSGSQYCRIKDIKYTTFCYWRQLLGKSRAMVAKSHFVPVVASLKEPSAPAPELFFKVGGFEVLVRRA